MNMKDLRQRTGKKVEQIALELGVSASTIHNWEQSRCIPRMTASSFKKLMDVYECTFEELVIAEEEITSSK